MKINVTEIEVRRGKLLNDFSIKLDGEKYPLIFTLTNPELAHVIQPGEFNPWYGTHTKMVQLSQQEIVVRSIDPYIHRNDTHDGAYKDTTIVLPLAEIIEGLKNGRNYWGYNDMLDMKEKYKPNVKLEISATTLKLINEYGLSDFVNSRIFMAENYSNGEQVNVHIGLDSFYWNFAPSFGWAIYYDKPKDGKQRIYNGAILFSPKRFAYTDKRGRYNSVTIAPNPEHIRRHLVWDDEGRTIAHPSVARYYGEWSTHT